MNPDVLERAKALGHDWGLHTSFCAHTMTFVARVRRAGDPSPHGRARVFTGPGAVAAAFAWIEDEVRAPDGA